MIIYIYHYLCIIIINQYGVECYNKVAISQNNINTIYILYMLYINYGYNTQEKRMDE